MCYLGSTPAVIVCALWATVDSVLIFPFLDAVLRFLVERPKSFPGAPGRHSLARVSSDDRSPFAPWCIESLLRF